jgi:LEA14-like dessication related protein
MKPRTALWILIALSLMTGCQLLQEITALKSCEFRLVDIGNVRLAGVNLSTIHSIDDLGLLNTGKIMDAFRRKAVSLEFYANVEGKNPNTTTAAMTKLDYIVQLDDKDVLDGSLDQRVEIPANGTSVIPVGIKLDVLKLLQNQTFNSLVNLGLNLTGNSNEPSRVTIKVKPYIQVGTGQIAYPGYIKLSQSFGSK